MTGREALTAGFGLVWNRHRGAVLALVLLSMLDAAAIAASLLVVSHQLRSTFDGRSLWPLAWTLVAVLVVQYVVGAAREAVSTVLHQSTATDISSGVIAAVRRVPYAQVQDNRWQGEVGLALREASYRPGFLVDNLVSVVEGVAGLAGVFVGAVSLAGPVILLLPVITVPVFFVEARLRSALVGVQTGSAPDLMRMQFLTQLVVDADWQRDVRVRDSRVFEDEFGVLANRYLDRLRRVVVRTHVWRALTGVLATAVVVLGALWLLGGAVTGSGRTDPATLTVLLAVLVLSARYLQTLVHGAGELFSSAEYLKVLLGVLRPEDDASGPQPARGHDVVGLDLENVSFGYPGSAPVLADLDLRLEPGITALTGPNGAGKTTLVKVLAGLLDPQSGQVRAVATGGERIAWDRAERAVLFQDSSHLRLTVRENVTLRSAHRPGTAGGDDAAEDRRIRAALDLAGLADVVRGLPDGLDTRLGPGFGGDVDLSGGQWQRLALARLFFSDAPVVICDEPATGLDVEAESRLMTELDRLAAGRIVLVVSHRPETLARSARVVVLDRGRIVRDGPPPAVGELPWAGGARPDPHGARPR